MEGLRGRRGFLYAQGQRDAQRSREEGKSPKKVIEEKPPVIPVIDLSLTKITEDDAAEALALAAKDYEGFAEKEEEVN